ncbi:MAG: FHA domain-containing protein [Myxococcales bacterium]|nr:FHA domain-containing protein [Myxococcales bacterium]
MSQDDDDFDPVQLPDEAQRIDAYRGEARWTRERFERLHGRAFLLMRRVQAERAKRPARRIQTLIQELPAESFRDLPPDRYLIFPLRKTERSLIERFYSVGQTRNNDVVIRDATVSKFHAYFQDDGSGGWLLQDAQSSNGTYVNEEAVPEQDQGDPVPVRPGDRVRFGTVELVLLDSEDFLSLLRQVHGGR